MTLAFCSTANISAKSAVTVDICFQLMEIFKGLQPLGKHHTLLILHFGKSNCTGLCLTDKYRPYLLVQEGMHTLSADVCRVPIEQKLMIPLDLLLLLLD